MRVAVFASGSGSNFESLVLKQKNYEVVLLITDKADAYALERAKKLGVKSISFSVKDFENKEKYETAIVKKLREENIEFIALAGYMRIIGKTLLHDYEGKMINVHPALLPDFKGKDAILQAIAEEVNRMGATVHYVDSGIDTGEIILQKSFSVDDDDSLEKITENMHKIEHEIFPKALNDIGVKFKEKLEVEK